MCAFSFFDTEQDGCAMGFSTQTFLLPEKNCINGAGVKVVADSELLHRNALLLKAFAGFFTGLLGYAGGVHSGYSCKFV